MSGYITTNISIAAKQLRQFSKSITDELIKNQMLRMATYLMVTDFMLENISQKLTHCHCDMDYVYDKLYDIWELFLAIQEDLLHITDTINNEYNSELCSSIEEFANNLPDIPLDLRNRNADKLNLSPDSPNFTMLNELIGARVMILEENGRHERPRRTNHLYVPLPNYTSTNNQPVRKWHEIAEYNVIYHCGDWTIKLNPPCL